MSASTQITNKLGLTPLAEAVVSGQVDSAKLLLGKVLISSCEMPSASLQNALDAMLLSTLQSGITQRLNLTFLKALLSCLPGYHTLLAVSIPDAVLMGYSQVTNIVISLHMPSLAIEKPCHSGKHASAFLAINSIKGYPTCTCSGLHPTCSPPVVPDLTCPSQLNTRGYTSSPKLTSCHDPFRRPCLPQVAMFHEP